MFIIGFSDDFSSQMHTLQATLKLLHRKLSYRQPQRHGQYSQVLCDVFEFTTHGLPRSWLGAIRPEHISTSCHDPISTECMEQLGKPMVSIVLQSPERAVTHFHKCLEVWRSQEVITLSTQLGKNIDK